MDFLINPHSIRRVRSGNAKVPPLTRWRPHSPPGGTCSKGRRRKWSAQILKLSLHLLPHSQASPPPASAATWEWKGWPSTCCELLSGFDQSTAKIAYSRNETLIRIRSKPRSATSDQKYGPVSTPLSLSNSPGKNNLSFAGISPMPAPLSRYNPTSAKKGLSFGSLAPLTGRRIWTAAIRCSRSSNPPLRWWRCEGEGRVDALPLSIITPRFTHLPSYSFMLYLNKRHYFYSSYFAIGKW